MIMTASSKTRTKKADQDSNKQDKQELKTDMPVSEKDEVKKAEEMMRKRVKGK
jgi:hypothetical protein